MADSDDRSRLAVVRDPSVTAALPRFKAWGTVYPPISPHISEAERRRSGIRRTLPSRPMRSSTSDMSETRLAGAAGGFLLIIIILGSKIPKRECVATHCTPI